MIKKFNLNYPNKFEELDFEFTNAIENDNNKKLLILDEFELLVTNRNITADTFNYLRAIISPITNLVCVTISEKKLSDLMIEMIEFVGSPLWNIFTEYEVRKK